MKKLLFLLLMAAGLHGAAQAQCNKELVWTGSKADFVDESGNVTETKQITVVIQIRTKEIKITHSDDASDTLKGAIDESTCDWKETFKNGKTSLKAKLADKSGDLANTTLTIEGKDGKILISIQIETPDGKHLQVRIPVDSYKELS